MWSELYWTLADTIGAFGSGGLSDILTHVITMSACLLVIAIPFVIFIRVLRLFVCGR